MTRKIAQVLTFLGGLYFFLEFLLPEEMNLNGTQFKFNKYHQELSIGLALISSFAIGLGVINILLVHGMRIVRSKKNILPSFVLIISFFVTLLIQMLSWIEDARIQNSWSNLQSISDYLSTDNNSSIDNKINKVLSNMKLIQDLKNSPAGISEKEYQDFILNKIERIEESIISQKDNSERQLAFAKKLSIDISDFKKGSLVKARKAKEESILWKLDHIIFYGLFLPLGSSMFSILGFYITYAAFRSFRVRSKESTVMMIAALIVILGQIPQGVIYISSDLPAARLWIMEYISTPAFRAIYFCSALAGLSLAVRMWFSMDKNPFLQR